MDCPKPEDDNLNDGARACTDSESGGASHYTTSAAPPIAPRADADSINETTSASQVPDVAQTGASDQTGSTDQASSTDQTGSSDQPNSTPSTGNSDQAVRLLQSMSQWLEGASCPSTDDGLLTGWSARYAEQFDREGEETPVDLAPILGLPEGTAKEEVVRVAFEQEEDLIRQLIS